MTVEVLNLESLANSSMYVSIQFERFGNWRKAKVEVKTEAVESRFSHAKCLLNSPELAAITKADNDIKTQVDALCLPSRHEMAGLRMAPNKNVLRIANILKDYKTVGRPALIAALVAAYPTQLAEARVELKEHFNPKHFPSVEELADEFVFEYAFINLGVPDVLGALSPELLEEEKEKRVENFKNAIDEVGNTLLASFAELVNKLNDGLNGTSNDGKKKSLLPSHFDKLTEFIAGFDAMASFAPEALKAEVAKMQQVMIGVDINKVRHSDNLRAELITKVGEAAKTMAAAGEVKGRFFRKPEPKPESQAEQMMAGLDDVEAHLKAEAEPTQPKSQAEADMLAAMLKSTGDNLGIPFQFEGSDEVYTPTEETDKLADEKAEGL